MDQHILKTLFKKSLLKSLKMYFFCIWHWTIFCHRFIFMRMSFIPYTLSAFDITLAYHKNQIEISGAKKRVVFLLKTLQFHHHNHDLMTVLLNKVKRHRQHKYKQSEQRPRHKNMIRGGIEKTITKHRNDACVWKEQKTIKVSDWSINVSIRLKTHRRKEWKDKSCFVWFQVTKGLCKHSGVREQISTAISLINDRRQWHYK